VLMQLEETVEVAREAGTTISKPMPSQHESMSESAHRKRDRKAWSFSTGKNRISKTI
jgi:hypothetical protein